MLWVQTPHNYNTFQSTDCYSEFSSLCIFYEHSYTRVVFVKNNTNSLHTNVHIFISFISYTLIYLRLCKCFLEQPRLTLAKLYRVYINIPINL